MGYAHGRFALREYAIDRIGVTVDSAGIFECCDVGALHTVAVVQQSESTAFSASSISDVLGVEMSTISALAIAGIDMPIRAERKIWLCFMENNIKMCHG